MGRNKTIITYEQLREKNKTYSKKYYEKNKDEVKARALARYYKIKNASQKGSNENKI
jgi:hypothetical protein